MSKEYIFTSESVSEGHPDKMCDQISDAVVDAAIAQDPNSRLGCEALAKSVKVGERYQHHIILAGEVTTSEPLDYEQIVKDVARDIGYDSDDKGFNYRSLNVRVMINEQSPDIAQGVDEDRGAEHEQGAGDQGLMFGFACDETDVLMPWPITYAHRLVKRQSEVRRNGIVDWLGPDAKSQVSVVYDGYVPKSVDAIVLSTQHSADASMAQVREAVIEEIIKPVIPSGMMPGKERIFVNPTGRFTEGGPQADCGLTGRKIIVDTYGGMARHGGGAFSGKDPSKVDRSASYATRHVAKNVVAAGLAKRCEVQVAYAIGRAEAVSFMVNTFGTGVCDDEQISKIARAEFDLRPRQIIERLDLLRPIYRDTAAYGHFGREEDSGFSWERLDRVEALKNAA